MQQQQRSIRRCLTHSFEPASQYLDSYSWLIIIVHPPTRSLPLWIAAIATSFSFQFQFPFNFAFAYILCIYTMYIYIYILAY